MLIITLSLIQNSLQKHIIDEYKQCMICDTKLNRKSTNQLILGKETVDKIKNSKILIVGAGGIGCELIKNLSKSGYRQFCIFDFDRIEITNLNRQFYFRKDHIGASKAEIVKNVLFEMDSSLKITAINASIFEKQYSESFYMQFDLIFSCLDNIKARQFLSEQATRCNKPLIDAGTMSYFGQAFASIRFRTSCHNCTPTVVQQAIPSCTIRTHPQLPLHCATYGKNFYDTFFGTNQAQSLSDKLKLSYYVRNDEKLSHIERVDISMRIFDYMFNQSISDIDLLGNKIDFIRKLSAQQANSMTQCVKNPTASSFNTAENQKQINSPYNEEKLWSIKKYFEIFVTSASNLLERKLLGSSPISFDKDDEDCMNLVLCITNLRTYNFMNQQSLHNKHKYLTYYQCKDMIGKIFPAIASTNAIAAALEAIQAIHIIRQDFQKLRYITIGNGQQKLSPCIQSRPNLQCSVCSKGIIYAKLRCDFKITTFGDLIDFMDDHFFTRGRDLMHGSISIIRHSNAKSMLNRTKHLGYFTQFIHNSTLIVSFYPKAQQPQYTIHATVFNQQNQSGISLKVNSTKEQVFNQLLDNFRKVHEQKVNSFSYQLEQYGGFQL